MLPDALCNLVVRQAELLSQSTQASRLFDWIEIGALQVFDEAEDQLVVVPGVAAHDGRYRGQAREPGRAPSPLTCDQLVAVGQLAHEQRLKDAVKPDRFGQLTEWFGLKSSAHLLMRGPNLIDRDHLRHQGFAFTRHRDQGFEAAAEAAHAWLTHRSSSSFASARYAIAPRHVGSYSSTDLP